jgi:valyl-tRNA synthetase
VPLVDAWLFARLAGAIELVNEALKNYRFHEAAQGVYQFFWGDFCDWYIEWVKPELQNTDRERAIAAWKNLFAAFDAALRLLHPFMPFLTEELWHQLPQKAGAKSIALDRFPEARVDWKNTKALSDVALIQEVVTAMRTIRAELKLDPKKKVQADFSAGDAVARDLIVANRAAIERFAALSGLRVTSERLQGDGMTRSTSAFDLRIPFTEIVNPQVEIARLKKEIEGLQKAIASKERQLGDETFRSRAPEKIIKGLEATLAEQRIELQKLQERLRQLEKGS